MLLYSSYLIDICNVNERLCHKPVRSLLGPFSRMKKEASIIGWNYHAGCEHALALATSHFQEKPRFAIRRHSYLHCMFCLCWNILLQCVMHGFSSDVSLKQHAFIPRFFRPSFPVLPMSNECSSQPPYGGFCKSAFGASHMKINSSEASHVCVWFFHLQTDQAL